MRFAKLAASFALLVILWTPLRLLVRNASQVANTRFAALNQMTAMAVHPLTLLVLFAVLVGLFWLLRFVLRAVGMWESSGLQEWDEPLAAGWLQLIAIAGSIALIVGAVAGGAGGRGFGLTESLFAAGAVLWALGIKLGGGRLPVPDIRPRPRPLPTPEPPPAPTPEPAPVPDSDDAVELALDWYYHVNPDVVTDEPLRFEIALTASRATYEEFKARDHSVHGVHDFGRFVRDGMCREVAELVAELREFSMGNSFDDLAEINNVLAFAQRFDYAYDDEDTGIAEYPKYPIEMLVDDRGDCEDHAIIAAIALKHLGYDVRLVGLPGHMALAVAAPEFVPGGWYIEDRDTGEKFYFCEVTTGGSSKDARRVALRLGVPGTGGPKGEAELVKVA